MPQDETAGELQGRSIGVTAERRTSPQQRFLHDRGATTLMAPVLHTIDITDRPELIAHAESIATNPPDVFVVQTGQGLKWWLESLPDEISDGVVQGLARSELWCRGPKATSACRKLGLHVEWQAPSELAAEIGERMDAQNIDSKRVMIQLDGSADDELVDIATHNGADAIGLNVYRYELPADREPVDRLIAGVIDGSLDAVTFTASPQIRHLREMAEDTGTLAALDAAFTGQCLVVVVGPVCAETARSAGWTNIIEPSTARLMPMLEALRVELVAD